MTKLIFTAFYSLAAFASAPGAEKPKPAAPPQKATCYVCKYNRDLGCLEFTLKPTTPRLTHGRREYCFCSEDCRKAFSKKPDKYAARQR